MTATFSRKRLFAYRSLVYATAVIALLSFTVWLHHFFTMSASANVNAVFGMATMIIAVPTGVKIFDWLLTMYRGRLHLAAPMYWTVDSRDLRDRRHDRSASRGAAGRLFDAQHDVSGRALP